METIIATAPAEVYRSKWGYHPCDRETYLELKEYHRYLLHDLRATRRQDRWNDKHEHNRKGPKPECYGTDMERYIDSLEALRAARHPQGTPDTVSKLYVYSHWRSRLAHLREFWGPIRHSRPFQEMSKN